MTVTKCPKCGEQPLYEARPPLGPDDGSKDFYGCAKTHEWFAQTGEPFVESDQKKTN